MDSRELLLPDMPLKHFLCLFDAAAPISIVALGDTMHPSTGYVDVSIVAEIKTVSQLLMHEYDFSGLVYFEAVIGSVFTKYHLERYKLSGGRKELAMVENRMRELNPQVDSSRVKYL